MTTPDRQSLPALLESGFIVESNLSLDDLSFSCTVEVMEHGSVTRYDLVFHHLTYFGLESEAGHREKGDRVELTQLWVEAAPEDSAREDWEIGISSYDLTILRLRSARITVDGITLT